MNISRPLTILTVTAISIITLHLFPTMGMATANTAAKDRAESNRTFDQIIDNMHKPGDIRMTGSMTFGRFKGESLWGMRGVIDYNLMPRGPFFNWSLALTGHFSLNKAHSMSK